MAFDSSMFRSGLGGLLGGMFGNSGKPYDKAMEQYQKYLQMGQGVQQPYLDAGKEGLGNYQEWLKGQKDPADFINNLMGQYQQSPYNSYLQGQAQNAGINAGSANGTMGSSALMQQMQQNAANIGQQGMDSWLQNALGINSQYGQGQQNLMQGGQNSANSLMNMYNNMGQQMGDAAYGKEAGKQNDWWNMLGGVDGIIGSFS
jgi:hypothetical protein